MELFSNCRFRISSYFYEWLVVMVKQCEHFVIDRGAVLSFANMKALFAKEIGIMRKGDTVFKTVHLQPIYIYATVYHDFKLTRVVTHFGFFTCPWLAGATACAGS